MESNPKYKVDWGEHAQTIVTNFNQLLNQKHLVDVTLVADGHLFNAHRLILSAISLNFRKMFTQMPANQQAYVFMKDVSRQTMENLIVYIYTGEVTVHQESLASLLEAAKSLDINGLTNELKPALFDQKQSNQFIPLKKTQWSSNGHQSISQMEYPSTNSGYQSNIIEFRSTQTNQIKKSQPTSSKHDILIKPKQEPSDCQPLLLNEDNFEIVEYSLADSAHEGNSKNVDENNFDDELLEFLMNNDETLLNELRDGHENNGKIAEAKPKAPEDVDGPKRKRFKRKFETSDYNLQADIRTEPNGIERLYHEQFQYRKNGKLAKSNTQSWICLKKDSISCRATARTAEINGVQMMYLITPEHCHQP